MVIGRKDSFAVGLEFSAPGPYVMGFVKIWLSNQYVGCDKEEEMLPSFVASLGRLVEREEIPGGELCLGDFEAEYERIQNDDRLHDLCLSGLGEAFDDFEIWCYRCGDAIRFIWRLQERPFHEYPGYGRGLRCADVPLADAIRVLDEVRTEVGKKEQGIG